MKEKLTDRIAKLEAAVAGPRFRTVCCETVYADDDKAEEQCKVDAAIAADRKSSGWDGDYVVLVPTAVHKKDGTLVPAHERIQRAEQTNLGALINPSRR
jgi:hypothetical protein